MDPLSRLTRRPGTATAVVAGVGLAGSVLVARASYVVGTLPGHHLDRAAATGPYRWAYEIGIALLVLAWLALGRLVLDPRVTGMTRRVCWAGAAMATPLLVSAPVTSQDVWAYLGQGNVAAHGLDPYAVGPSAAPGPFADAVARAWVDVPSAYGPLWTWISRLVVDVVQPHPWAGMFLLRLVALAGIVATALALTRLCRVTGGRPEVALWLALAGPFPLLMLVGAVHNDAVMVALLLGGVAVAATVPSMRRALVAGAVLVGLAAAIKVVALAALPFLPLVWHRYAAAPRDQARPPAVGSWIRNGAVTTAVGVITLLVSGIVLGFGVGWISHVGDGAVGVRWLSVPQQAANVVHLFAPDRVAATQRLRYGFTHPLGLALLGVSLAVVSLTALRRPPLRMLCLALLLVAVSSPAPRLWYLLWPLMFLVADRLSPRLLTAVAAATATLALWYPPSVLPPVPEWVLVALFVPLVALTWGVVRSATGPSPDPSGETKATVTSPGDERLH
jgi:alpha-1,6-mannosyltransferase